ncbi:hypothetical protein BDAP_002736 [Binucleata daphniae]
MNTILSHFMLYQAIFYTTSAHEGETETTVGYNDEYKKCKIDTKKIDDYYEKLQIITKKNRLQKALYDEIIKEYETYVLDLNESSVNTRGVLIKVKIKEESNINYLETTFNKIKRELLQKKEHKDTVLDSEFDYAFNLFIEIAAFAMDTLIQINDLRNKIQNNDEFRNELSKNVGLFEDYIISINWLTEIRNQKTNIALLHNFDYIYSKKNPTNGCYILEINYIFYNHDNSSIKKYTKFNTYSKVNMIYKFKQDVMEKLLSLLPNYYLNFVINNKKIFEKDNLQKIKNYYNDNNDEKEIKEDYTNTFEIAYNAIVIERSLYTNIPFIAKSSYYRYRNHLPCLAEPTETQKNFIHKLKEITCLFTNQGMIFDVLHIHTSNCIINICSLSTMLEEKIDNLTDFTLQYVNILMKSIYENCITAINSYFDNLINNQSQINMSLNEL